MTSPLHLRELAPGTGAGTVLLLHGVTDSGQCWAGAAARWAGRPWRLVALDARGHGLSPRWDDERLAGRPGDVMADDALAVLEGLDVPVALVGHSMGAAVAVAAAARAPHLVAGVVAEDPPWPLPPLTAPDPVRARAYVAGHAEERALGYEGRLARRAEREPHWPAEEVEPLARAVDLVDERLLATGDIVPSTPWPDLLRTVTGAGVPVLVLTGTRDVRVPADSEQRAREAGADVVRLDGAGHCVRRDDADGYHRVVDLALTRWLG